MNRCPKAAFFALCMIRSRFRKAEEDHGKDGLTLAMKTEKECHEGTKSNRRSAHVKDYDIHHERCSVELMDG